MMDRRAPYASPSEISADEYMARSAIPGPPDIGEPWDETETSRKPLWTVLLLAAAGIVGCVAAFIATLP